MAPDAADSENPGRGPRFFAPAAVPGPVSGVCWSALLRAVEKPPRGAERSTPMENLNPETPVANIDDGSGSVAAARSPEQG